MKKILSRLDQEKFIKAQKLSEEGNVEATMKVMQELVLSNPDSGILRAVLANAYGNLDIIDKAEEEFKKAVKLKPNLEKASLGLFHCLLGQSKKREAFAEMERFLKISDCDDYREIKKEIIEKLESIENYLRI